MLQIERQEQILELLERSSALRIGQIAAALYISEATVRRDVATMEQKGLLRRVYGGVTLKKEDMPIDLRRQEHAAAKEEIALQASRLIEDGKTVFLDSSSTAQHLLPYLSRFRELTVITNSPHTCVALAEQGVRSLCTGGELLTGSLALVGSDAERFVRGIRAHVCVFSARGVCEGEISDSSKAERDLKIAMLQSAERSVFLCDSSKEGRRYPYVIATLSAVGAYLDER